ncbi:VOC family protein [Salinispora tropica]|uniref:Glyoxalase/bleomycin resistance protein/dioxygenase n=1 Tax=Salinispora tropica (strain ATCC BAA-916 / DSM 44818 / JCM 13857 / NBRC 105044 / CNB-440) TaxID=369723 RepID=A4X712_SALTO|nr:VOC family protein [Salinispora tropica]ABP54662.1 Glyoxalase/bleomycin resistance protein/dioxygenase [Salinispora tropica CNB-440]
MLLPDTITLGATDAQAAHVFYRSVFSPTAVSHQDERVELDLHGVARLAVCPVEELAAQAHAGPAAPNYRGYVLSYIVNQPDEVRSILDAAARQGASVLKPAKKAMFAGFSGAFQAPDGAVWKLTSAKAKATGPAQETPVPNEVGVLLGVAATKSAKSFYAALGMVVDRDYGSKYIDFQPSPAGCRLGLMDGKVLAKDVGTKEDSADFRAAAFERMVPSPDEVDSLLSAVAAAGGRVVAPAAKSGSGVYAGYFTDPDGFLWKVTSG